MRRRPFTILSAVSLVLCSALVGLWVRSYWRFDGVDSPRWNGRTYSAYSERGLAQLVVIHWVDSVTAPHEWGFSNERLRPGERRLLWIYKPIYVFRTDDVTMSINGTLLVGTTQFIVISDWLLVIVTGTLPTFWLWHRLRNRRRNRVGCCPACGYNLTGNVSGVCPECGMPVSSQNASTSV